MIMVPPNQQSAAEPVSGPGAAESPPLGLDSRYAAMIPPELIEGGEIIVMLIKPSLWFVILSQLRLLAGWLILTALAYGLDAWLGSSLRRREIVIVGFVAIGLTLLWGFFEWLSRTYILTDRRVIALSGVFRVQIIEAALERVQHTRLVVSLRERSFGLGTLAIATAGTASDEIYWHMVAQPLEVHQQLINVLRRYRRN